MCNPKPVCIMVFTVSTNFVRSRSLKMRVRKDVICNLWKFSSEFYYSKHLSFQDSRKNKQSYLNRSMSSGPGDKFKVFVTRRVPESGIELLKPKCEITQWNRDDPIPRDELINGIRGVDALFCLLTDRIDDDVLEAAGPQLKVVGTMSVGYDHVDLAACKRLGLPVGFTPDVLTDATAELTIALLLAVSRRIVEGVAAVKSGAWGTWAPLWMCGSNIASSTVGIVGLGRIGLAVAQRLKPFGVHRFLYTGSSPKDAAKEVGAEFVSLDDLLSQSDYVIVTCALTPHTKEMFNRDLFHKMKSSAIFVNTSRGGVVNQEHLYEALKNNTIKAAGLDVTVPEPLPTDSPLLQLDNCVVLPHIGSATDETRSMMSTLCAKNILAALEGKEMPARVKID